MRGAEALVRLAIGCICLVGFPRSLVSARTGAGPPFCPLTPDDALSLPHYCIVRGDCCDPCLTLPQQSTGQTACEIATK